MGFLGDIILNPGSELRVLAGSRVLIEPGKSIKGQDARVSIQGTAAFPVIWQSADGTNTWGELTLTGERAELEMRHVDFQRGWVWDDEHIRSLLVSIDHDGRNERARDHRVRRHPAPDGLLLDRKVQDSGDSDGSGGA